MSQQPAPERDRDHAETYVRLLAEAALRAAGSPERAEKVQQATDVLVDAGVLDDARADEILLTLTEALAARGQRGWTAHGRVHRLGAITVPARKAVQSGKTTQSGRTAGHSAWHVIRDPPGQVPGSKLMALIVAGDRMIAPATMRFFPLPADRGDPAAPSFADLTASDDLGSGYQVSFTEGGWAGGAWTGTMLLRPAPARGARLLTINGPNGPVLRAPLTPGPAAGQVEATAVPLPDSPGERLLIRLAETMLGTLAGPRLPRSPTGHAGPGMMRRAGGPQFLRPARPGLPGNLPPSPVKPAVGPPPFAVASGGTREPRAGLAEIIEVLEGARALSPLSRVPAAVAALSQALGVAGLADLDGDPAARRGQELPARWQAVLAYYGRRAQQPLASGTGSIGGYLPEVDGTRFAVAGVHTSRAGTVLRVVGRGLRPTPGLGQDLRFSWWIGDDEGTWHLAIAQGWHTVNADLALRLVVLPPLRPGTPGSTGTLTLEVTGTTSRLTAQLTVHW